MIFAEFLMLRRKTKTSSETALSREARKRATWAILASVTLHLLAFNLFIVRSAPSLLGRPSTTFEGGTSDGVEGMPALALTLVSPEAARTPKKKDTLTQLDANPTVPPEQTNDMALKGVEGAEEAQDGDTKQVIAAETASEADQVNPVLIKSAAAANGSPDGSEDIIRQIARCLPNGVRPALAKVHLNLQLDEEGQLAMVPQLDIDLDGSTHDQIMEANLVIQATLQCGPYVLPQKTPQTISLAADFTQAKP